MNKVTILGSFVIDLTAFLSHILQVGEMAFADVFKYGPGRKGFNQAAVAVKKAGAEVVFMTEIGHDAFASIAEETFTQFGLDKSYLLRSTGCGTSVALITVDADRENATTVVSSICTDTSIEEIHTKSAIFKDCDVFVPQFEANLDITSEAVKVARSTGVVTIFNRTPVRQCDKGLFHYGDIVIPNGIEASQLAMISLGGTDNLFEIVSKLERFVYIVITGLGGKGVFCSEVSRKITPDMIMNMADLTGMGDVFVGFSAFSYYSKGASLKDGVDHVRVGAVISTARRGDSPSISMSARNEIEEFYTCTVFSKGMG